MDRLFQQQLHIGVDFFLQSYHRRDEPHKSKLIKSGYLQPGDGYKVVETIKDPHVYEKPHTVHGYHQNDVQKDYHAIKESYELRKKADDEFNAAYNEVNKVHDDYKSEYREFEKFAKNYNGYSKVEKEYKIDTYDAPKKAEEKLKKEKKVKYKETRYHPPLMKPNKYGEITDIPPKYKEFYEKETLKYDAHDPPQYEPPLYEPTADDDEIKYDSDDSPPYEHTNYDSPSYPEPKQAVQKYDSPKYEALPPDSTKKVYITIDDDDGEFNRFYHVNGYTDTKSKGDKYLEGKFGEYGVGHVEKTSIEKPKKSYSAPLKEEIHGSVYIRQWEQLYWNPFHFVILSFQWQSDCDHSFFQGFLGDYAWIHESTNIFKKKHWK